MSAIVLQVTVHSYDLSDGMQARLQHDGEVKVNSASIEEWLLTALIDQLTDEDYCPVFGLGLVKFTPVDGGYVEVSVNFYGEDYKLDRVTESARRTL